MNWFTIPKNVIAAVSGLAIRADKGGAAVWQPAEDIQARNVAELASCASPSLPATARLRFETAIIAGKKVCAKDVKRARGRLPTGRPA